MPWQPLIITSTMAKTDDQRINNQSDLGQHSTRRVIRDLDTGLFFDKGNWTTDASLAQDFPDHEAIKTIVVEHQIQNAEMVLLEGPKNRVRGGFRIRYP